MLQQECLAEQHKDILSIAYLSPMPTLWTNVTVATSKASLFWLALRIFRYAASSRTCADTHCIMKCLQSASWPHIVQMTPETGIQMAYTRVSA